MAQNAHLGKTYNVQSEKVGDGVISKVIFTKVCFKGKITAKFKLEPKISHNFPTEKMNEIFQQTTYTKQMLLNRLAT